MDKKIKFSATSKHEDEGGRPLSSVSLKMSDSGGMGSENSLGIRSQHSSGIGDNKLSHITLNSNLAIPAGLDKLLPLRSIIVQEQRNTFDSVCHFILFIFRDCS